MKRFIISAITVFLIISGGCGIFVVRDRYVGDELYDDRLVYVYDYGEAIPYESGIYESWQAALECVVEWENTWTYGVETTASQVDIIKAGKELERIVGRLCQQVLYEDFTLKGKEFPPVGL